MAIDLTTDIGLYFADAYASLSAAVSAMPTRGGTLILGNKDYTVSSSITVDKPVKFVGAGCANANLEGGATIISTSGTGNLFDVQAHGVTFEGIHFKNTATSPAAGSAVKFSGLSSGTVPCRGFRILNCSFDGFYDSLSALNAYTFIIQGCYFGGAVRYNIDVACTALPDAGDSTITGNNFVTTGYNTVAHIHQVTSGGLRITNNKFNCAPAGASFKPQYHYLGDMDQTVIVSFTGNSFENYTARAIKLTGTSWMRHVLINANQFAAYNNTGADIELIGLTNCVLTGNTLQSGGHATAIVLTNCVGVKLFNGYESYTNRYTQTGSSGIQDLNT
jgi:hypothetical protein